DAAGLREVQQRLCRGRRVAALEGVVLDRAPLDQVDDVLGDVRGEVRNALEVAGYEQQVHARGDLPRVLHHVREKDPEVVVVQLVDPVVHLGYASGLLAVPADERVQGQREHLRGNTRHLL